MAEMFFNKCEYQPFEDTVSPRVNNTPNIINSWYLCMSVNFVQFEFLWTLWGFENLLNFMHIY